MRSGNWSASISAGSAASVKFGGEVTPNIKKVTYKVDMKRVINRRLVMGIGDGILEADGTPIYWAEDLRVGLYQR
jgi:3-hydroxyacyl-[acyl-carrier protein] dehydratase / trans-2-decenoyl-[acyl-carrier protein] isomerase